jgi:NADH:ubiquinone oxidoreductase subunit 6 (subunit J)
MLTPLASRDNANSLYVIPGILGGLGIASLVGFVAIDTEWVERRGADLTQSDFTETINQVGQLLLGRYVLAFEIASVLLLFALLGAIVLVHERRGGGMN